LALSVTTGDLLMVFCVCVSPQLFFVAEQEVINKAKQNNKMIFLKNFFMGSEIGFSKVRKKYKVSGIKY